MSENPQAFKPIKKRRLSDEVTAQIRAGIAAGDIVPGDKLPAERQMADSFAVSRGAVREALRNLELAGVVNMQHGVHGGAFVTNGNPGIMGDFTAEAQTMLEELRVVTPDLAVDDLGLDKLLE